MGRDVNFEDPPSGCKPRGQKEHGSVLWNISEKIITATWRTASRQNDSFSISGSSREEVRGGEGTRQVTRNLGYHCRCGSHFWLAEWLGLEYVCIMPSRVTQDVTDRVLSTYVVTMDQFYTCHHAICLLRLIDYICSHIYPFFMFFTIPFMFCGKGT